MTAVPLCFSDEDKRTAKTAGDSVVIITAVVVDDVLAILQPHHFVERIKETCKVRCVIRKVIHEVF